MSDLDPSTLDVAKVGGGAGLASLATLLLSRIFGSHDKALDKVLIRLDLLQTSVTDSAQKLAILVEQMKHRDSEMEHHQERLVRLEEQSSDHAERLVRIEALLEKLK